MKTSTVVATQVVKVYRGADRGGAGGPGRRPGPRAGQPHRRARPVRQRQEHADPAARGAGPALGRHRHPTARRCSPTSARAGCGGGGGATSRSCTSGRAATWSSTSPRPTTSGWPASADTARRCSARWASPSRPGTGSTSSPAASSSGSRCWRRWRPAAPLLVADEPTAHLDDERAGPGARPAAADRRARRHHRRLHHPRPADHRARPTGCSTSTTACSPPSTTSARRPGSASSTRAAGCSCRPRRGRCSRPAGSRSRSRTAGSSCIRRPTTRESAMSEPLLVATRRVPLVRRPRPRRARAAPDQRRRCTPADVLAVTGPSGTGKSTLVSILAGWDRPTSGTVERPARTVFVPQRLALLDTLTVLDNIALADAARARRRARAGRRAGASTTCWTGSPARSRSASGSGSAWPARCTPGPRSRSSTSRPRTRTPTTPGWSSTPLALAARGCAVVIATHDPVVVAVATARRSARGGGGRELNPVHLAVRQHRQRVDARRAGAAPTTAGAPRPPRPAPRRGSGRRPRTRRAATPTPRRGRRAPRPSRTAGVLAQPRARPPAPGR